MLLHISPLVLTDLIPNPNTSEKSHLRRARSSKKVYGGVEILIFSTSVELFPGRVPGGQLGKVAKAI